MSRTPATSRVTSSHPAQLSLLLAPLPPRLPDSAGGWDRGGLAWAAQRTLIQPLSATMSGSRFPGPDRGAPEPLLDDLIGYYTDRAEEGQLRVCRQAALIRRAQQLLGMRAPPQLCLPEDVAPDLEPPHSQGAPSSAQHICHKLVRALEFLELISVNLLLSPWRKEIRSLKTYTGNFAYWVRPVLSEHTLHAALGRLGYRATSKAEFSLVQAASEEDTKQMVFEIFLTRVACEAVLGTLGGPVLSEKVAGRHRRPSPGRGPAKTRTSLREARPSLSAPAGMGTDRTRAEGAQGQGALPMAWSPPEVPVAPHSPLPGPLVPLGPWRRASTRSDSEEFLTCYSDLILHQTPLFPGDWSPSSLKEQQLQGPAQAPGPPLGEAATTSCSSGKQFLVPSAAPESEGVTIRRQLCLRPGPQWSEHSLAPKPEAQTEPAAPDTYDALPHAPPEMDQLCELLAHLLTPPSSAGRLWGPPGPGVDENKQPQPLMGREAASEGGSPDRVTQLWRAPEASSHVREPPSTHYVPLEGPVPTRGYCTSHSRHLD
uniref:Spermatogenesis-associated protein 2 PUB-like domain-containing protein n=1 Tax=Sus scrofa TaxID=9823 RepID=A0A8D0Q289_PIG